MTGRALRALTGVATVVAIVAVFALAATLFRGGFTDSVPVTVTSPRAGLVMNPDAKVQIRGVQVGKVDSIEQLPNGEAAIHLAMDPKRLDAIPANVLVDIASTTVFGAKYVQFVFPPDPSPESLRPGQVLAAKHVMVEINTVFENLTSVLSKVDPPKLNETLGAIAAAVNGRGEKIGQMLTDLDAYLARIEPSLPALNHDLEVAPQVLRAYSDAASDFIAVADNASRISDTIVDQQHNLDAALVSVIGLADIGNDVVGTNRQPLTDVLHLLVPTTDLLNKYNQALWCALSGMVETSHRPAAEGTRCCDHGRIPVGPGAIPISDGPTEGRRNGRPAVHRPAEHAVRRRTPLCRRRHRDQPVATHQPRDRAEFRWLEEDPVR